MLMFCFLVAVATAAHGFDSQQAVKYLLELDTKLPEDIDLACESNPNVSGPRLSASDILKLKFTHYVGNNRREYAFYPEGGKLLVTSPDFDPTKPTVVMVHSELDSTSHLVTGGVVNEAFNTVGPHNVVALDCGTLLVPMTTRAKMARYVGEGIAVALKDMMESRYDVNQIYLIGHEIGAHVTGFAGKAFQSLTGHKLRRITALNPSSRCFEDVGKEGRLSDEDAEYVQVVHTKSGTEMKKAVGDIDFYLVDSLPSTPWMELWHTTVWKFYASAVKNDGLFIGVQCDSLRSFEGSLCQDHATAVLRYAEDGTKQGSYYLRVGSKDPYGLGEQGLYPALEQF